MLVGDAILYLEQTNCQEIMYFGACGLVQETDQLTIGSLVCPKACLSFESFTDTILRHTNKITTQYPDQTLFQSFLTHDLSRKIQPAIGMSIGSLKCEESYKEFFDEEGIDVVDMECSAFFSAARYIQKKAIALLYVTDIIGKKSFFEPLEPKDKLQIDSTIQTACKAIRSFCKSQLTTEDTESTKNKEKKRAPLCLFCVLCALCGEIILTTPRSSARLDQTRFGLRGRSP